MDTGNHMVNQMDDLIEQGKSMNDEFNEWIYEVCLLKPNPQKTYNNLDLTDAKLSFLDGMSVKEYSKTIIL